MYLAIGGTTRATPYLGLWRSRTLIALPDMLRYAMLFPSITDENAIGVFELMLHLRRIQRL